MTLATKKIPELDPYGSVTKPAYLMDLLEISKNDGTYESPTYGSGTSRKITVEQFIDNIGAIPYSGQNYEVVKAVGTPTQNGVALLAAIAKCNAKTPNGNSISPSNMATLYIWSGDYDVPSSILANPLVKFVGIGEKENIKIYSTSSLSYIIVVNSSGVQYSLSNLTINNPTSGGLSIAHGVGIVDVGIWDNVIIGAKTSIGQEYAGAYNQVQANAADILNGIVSGKISNSKTTFINCFGATSSTGVLDNCTMLNCPGVQLGKIVNCNLETDSGYGFTTLHIDDGCSVIRTSVIGLNPSQESIEVEAGAEVKIILCETNKGINKISGSAYTNLIPLPRNVIWGEKAEYFVSPYPSIDGFYHRFKKYVDTSGDFQTEDLGPV